MAERNFVKIGGRFFAISAIASISPLSGGDVIVSFFQPLLRDASGQPTTDIRISGGEARAFLSWIESISDNPSDRAFGLPDRFT